MRDITEALGQDVTPAAVFLTLAVLVLGYLWGTFLRRDRDQAKRGR